MMYGNYANGPQRAKARAHFRGLTIGAPVRAHIGEGNRPLYPFPHVRTYAGPGGAKPLERIDRMARYLLQRDVTTHVRHGSRWQPTPRQRRRLDKKSKSAHLRAEIAEMRSWRTQRETDLTRRAEPQETLTIDRARSITDAIFDGPSKSERERSAINRNGYRVVDRRGEHRA